MRADHSRGGESGLEGDGRQQGSGAGWTPPKAAEKPPVGGIGGGADHFRREFPSQQGAAGLACGGDSPVVKNGEGPRRHRVIQASVPDLLHGEVAGEGGSQEAEVEIGGDGVAEPVPGWFPGRGEVSTTSW